LLPVGRPVFILRDGAKRRWERLNKNMDGPFPPAPQHFQADGEATALEMLARNVRGASQLLAMVAQSAGTPPALRAGLDLLACSLRQSADQADRLIDDVGIDISNQLGITTNDLANMRFAPVNPEFHRKPGSVAQWHKTAEDEFALWGDVEDILSEDDAGLEQRFSAAPQDHLRLVDSLEALRERWQHDMKLLEATLLRLAVAVARWEQSGEA
jgi:hypothetical protein